MKHDGRYREAIDKRHIINAFTQRYRTHVTTDKQAERNVLAYCHMLFGKILFPTT